MGIITNAKIAEALPYTVGDGKPSYRTNPITGLFFTPQERAKGADDTINSYGLGNLLAYLQPEYHAYDVQG